MSDTSAVEMHLHWERSANTAGDCNIRSLSWMGRVPDEIPQVSEKSSDSSCHSMYIFTSIHCMNM